ncbi:MAG: 2-thiouracil desulfurase family protein, partial [Acidimicrobiia bacterium]
MKRPQYIVSACLIGERCRYNGEDKAHAGVIRFLRGKNYSAVCPEMLAGWGNPRPPV